MSIERDAAILIDRLEQADDYRWRFFRDVSEHRVTECVAAFRDRCEVQAPRIGGPWVPIYVRLLRDEGLGEGLDPHGIARAQDRD